MSQYRCAACGSPNIAGSISVAMLCRDCTPIVEGLLASAHAAGGSVNILKICRKYFEETHRGGDYLLRDIPMELQKKMEHRAVDDETSVREIILRALEGYLQ
jgi:hypothetical protein